jgi:aromatic ring-opening dioxygenase LigB subunit
MSLVFASILPHSPLLVPNIGKKNQELFTATLEANKIIAAQLIAAEPDVVIIISSDDTKANLSFAINLSPKYVSDLSAFGDLVTRWQFKGEATLASQFRECLEGQETIQLITNEELNYTASIALSLAGVTEIMPIMPIITNSTNLKSHFLFGQHIQNCIVASDKKIAVIASADLSHRLNKKSPAGYLAKAKKLDQKIITCITSGKPKELLSLSSEVLQEAAVEDLATISVLLGIIEGFNWPSRLLSYESPFGVGHAVIGYNF